MAADLEGGFVRNIIGDRVMVVFPEDYCYTKAVNCAITINHIAKRINEIFGNVDFKCGIGIDYGTMNVMKVGVVKKVPRMMTTKDSYGLDIWQISHLG